MRTATNDDRELLIDWVEEFLIEAVGGSANERAEDIVDSALQTGSRTFYLWEDDGRPVSMAGVTGPTPNGIRVGPVYTPPGSRRRGYGSAVTAAASQAQLDAGRTFVFLFTDLDNPTSNRIYQAIGYEPVIDVDQLTFQPRERTLTGNATAGTILRDPVFARLWFIQAANQVGGNMALYALTVLVYSSTRSNSMVSALLVSFVLPQIALSPFAGVIVDRLDLRWALVVPNLVRTVLTAGLALAGVNIAVVLALNLGVSLMSVALTPAEGSMIPRVVPKEQLETAMSVFNLTLQASFAVGFAFFGPLLVTISSPSFVLAVVTLFYVAASIACIGLPSAPPIPPEAGQFRSELREPIHQLRAGLRGRARRPGDQPADHPARHGHVGRRCTRRPGAVAGDDRRPRTGASGRRRRAPRDRGRPRGPRSAPLRRDDPPSPDRRGRAVDAGCRDHVPRRCRLARRRAAAAGFGFGALPIVIGVAVAAGAAYAVTRSRRRRRWSSRRRLGFAAESSAYSPRSSARRPSSPPSSRGRWPTGSRPRPRSSSRASPYWWSGSGRPGAGNA